MTIALNIVYVELKEAYMSKGNSNCEKQIILLMIPNERKKKASIILQ